jgi:CheY-like chemotaxis protein
VVSPTLPAGSGTTIGPVLVTLPAPASLRYGTGHLTDLSTATITTNSGSTATRSDAIHIQKTGHVASTAGLQSLAAGLSEQNSQHSARGISTLRLPTEEIRSAKGEDTPAARAATVPAVTHHKVSALPAGLTDFSDTEHTMPGTGHSALGFSEGQATVGGTGGEGTGPVSQVMVSMPAFGQSWGQLGVVAGTLLVSDSRHAGTSTDDSSGDGILGPLWGFVFSRSLRLQTGSQEQQRTILVALSDETSRDTLTARLVNEGFLVLAAATGRDALNLFRAPLAPIDLMLLDTQLPDVSGVQLYQRLREIRPKLPLTVFTGTAEPAEVDRLRTLGAHYYLRTPVAVEHVVSTVHSLLL